MPSHTPTQPKPWPAGIEQRLRKLTDDDLLFRTMLAVRREHALTITILHHLNEIDRRRLYLELGYASLFDYCTRRLNYSSSAACRRIQAARCIRRFPMVLTLLHAGELGLSTIALIAPILTSENAESILGRVRGRSYRAVERVVSDYRAPVAIRDRVRPVRVPATQPVDVDRILFERELERIAPYAAGPPTPGVGSAIPTEQKLFVQFLASEELMTMFEEAKALLSQQPGDGSFDAVLAVVLEDFLDRHSPKARHQRRERRRKEQQKDRQKEQQEDRQGIQNEKRRDQQPSTESKPQRTCAAPTDNTHSQRRQRGTDETPTDNTHSRRRECKNDKASTDSSHSQRRVCGDRAAPSTPPRTPRPADPRHRQRHIPNAVKDAVYVRDDGRCTFTARDGTRYGSRHAVQVDHIHPFATGGSHDPSNLRLLCAQHNRLAAEQTLGPHIMKRFRRRE